MEEVIKANHIVKSFADRKLSFGYLTFANFPCLSNDIGTNIFSPFLFSISVNNTEKITPCYSLNASTIYFPTFMFLIFTPFATNP